MRQLAWFVFACVLGGCSAAEGTNSSPVGPELLEHPLLYSGSPEDTKDYLVDRFERVERSIQACMKAEGFDYELGTIETSEPVLRSGDRVAFARRSGFGHAQQALNVLTEMGPAVPVGQEPTPEPPSGPAADAYLVALYGSAEPGLSDDDASPGSCRGIALGEIVRAEDQMVQAIRAEFGDLYDRIEADERMVTIRRDWSACMAQRGHSYQNPREMQLMWATALTAFIEAVDPRDETQRLGALDQLAELLDQEIGLAVDAIECEADSVDVIEQIADEYRDAFWNDKGTELQAILDNPGS